MAMFTTYSNVHRVVLQRFLRDKAITEQDLLALLKKAAVNYSNNIHEAAVTIKHLDEIVNMINKNLNECRMEMELRKRKAIETDSKIYWVLCNKKDDKISTKATNLSDKELLEFKTLLTHLVESEYGNLTAAEIRQATKALSHHEREALLDKLRSEKWLCEDQNKAGKFTGGIRMLTELEPDLKKLGAVECKAIGFHVLNTLAYRRALGQEDCAEEENDDERDFDGEQTLGDSPTKKKQSKKAPKKRAVSDDEEEEEEEEEEEDDHGDDGGTASEEEPVIKRRTKRTRR